MKTITLATLLLGTIAIGTVPAAGAHDRDARRSDQDSSLFRAGHDPRARSPRARQVREIRTLAFRLERAGDALWRHARRAAGRVDRSEARSLRAIRRLENATDRFRRVAQRRGPFAGPGRKPFARRELRHGLYEVDAAFREARLRADALWSSNVLRRDLRRVDRLIGALDDRLSRRRRVAWGQRTWWLAQR